MHLYKYSVLGTSILVVDGITGPLVSCNEQAEWAAILGNPNYGVGCDYVAFLSLSEVHKNFQSLPGFNGGSELRVNVFSVLGDKIGVSFESYCAVADCLYRLDGRTEVFIVSNTTTENTTVSVIHRDLDSATYNMALPETSVLPAELRDSLYNLLAEPMSGRDSFVRIVRPLLNLTGDAYPANLLAINTGEPYLVCFVGDVEFSKRADVVLDDVTLLTDLFSNPQTCGLFQQSLPVQQQIINQILQTLFGGLESLFPIMMPGYTLLPASNIFDSTDNVGMVFAHINKDGIIESRFFCGSGCREVRMVATGAVAAVVAAVESGLLLETSTQVRSFLNVVEGRHKALNVHRIGSNWWVEASVQRVWTGTFDRPDS